jgi:hypothetical protein
MKSKRWMTHRKRKKAENCTATQPWVKSTGPKTTHGKSRASQNATTHGMRSKVMLDLQRALSQQLQFIRDLEKS